MDYEKALINHIKSLTIECKAALYMYFINNMSIRQVAKELDTSYLTIRNYIIKAGFHPKNNKSSRKNYWKQQKER